MLAGIRSWEIFRSLVEMRPTSHQRRGGHSRKGLQSAKCSSLDDGTHNMHSLLDLVWFADDNKFQVQEQKWELSAYWISSHNLVMLLRCIVYSQGTEQNTNTCGWFQHTVLMLNSLASVIKFASFSIPSVKSIPLILWGQVSVACSFNLYNSQGS